MRGIATMTLLALVQLPLSSCKAPQQSSDLNAEAAAVAAGQEVLLSEGSVPEPQASPKQSPEDLKAELHQLAGQIFDRGDVAKFQVPGSSSTSTPRELQGIWWMDGNPLADETISFARVDFGIEKPLMPVFGLNNFSFHSGQEPGSNGFPLGDRDYREGSTIYSMAKATGLVYEFIWNGSPNKYTSAKIIPTVVMKILGVEKRLRVSQKIMAFTMIQKGEHLYSRDNTLFGKPIDGYQLRRILVPSASDPTQMEKTEWWDLYMKQPGPQKLRLANRR